jgi:Na+/proline symporter
LVIIYTVIGGSDAVTVTQKYQIGVIFAGMFIAFGLLLAKMPAGLTFTDSLRLAGHFHKLRAVNFSTSLHERYTFWSGVVGGTFFMLSYFGTDQSQVQRYLSGASLRESRLGLMFNAVFKIPMQFGILLLGVLIFVFYQFAPAPLFFNDASRQYLVTHGKEQQVQQWEHDYNQTHDQTRVNLEHWLAARHDSNAAETTDAATALAAATATQQQGEQIRTTAATAFQAAAHGATANDADYIFITFILNYLPHGVIGLLVAAFFAAALSSKSAELNALGSSTAIDFYRHLKRDATDRQCLLASKWFTALWGAVAIAFALYAHLLENLIVAVNILGSIFYGVMLGLFVVAFFIRFVSGTAVFWAAVIAQGLVVYLYFNLAISFLWFPLIGCACCVWLSLMLQAALGRKSIAHSITT